MVGVKMRLYNPDWTNCTDLARRDVDGNAKMYFEILYAGTASATATEIGAAANSIDATHLTTPMQLIVVSSDNTKDKLSVAAGCAHKVRIIGITVASSIDYVNGVEKPVYSVESVDMLGTTNATTTRYYLRTIHAYVSSWGTDASHDAEGNITIEEPENTTLLTIAATYNESNGGVIYGCDGYYGRWCLLDLSHQDPDINAT